MIHYKKISFISMFLLLGLMLSFCLERPQLAQSIGKPSGMTFSVTPSTDKTPGFSFSYGASSSVITHRIVMYNMNNPSSSAVSYAYNTSNPSQTITATLESNYAVNQNNKFRAVYYAYGQAAMVDSVVKDFDQYIEFKLDEAFVSKLTANSSKTWKIDRTADGYLGVGPLTNNFPEWYKATKPDEKPDCFFDDLMTFTLNADNTISMQYQNQGQTFIHIDHQQNVVGTRDAKGEDACFDYTPVQASVLITPSKLSSPVANSTGIQINTAGVPIAYMLESYQYEVLQLSDDRMYLRTIETAPNGEKRAWYLRLVSNKPSCASGRTGNTAGSGTYKLVWEDNFDANGTPCANNWVYDIGVGNGGWGNREAQYYTNRSGNIEVKDGVLKITAKKETFSGSSYTSARIKTKGLFEFTYGKVEVRAKLPTAGGTWPAIWTLGANIDQVNWPACGEIDIMEHVGNNNNVVLNAIHTSSSSGNTINKNSTSITNTNEFHVYGIEWTAEKIDFFIDNTLVYTYNPATKNNSTWPFTKDQFLLLNVAMGGTLGGAIDPNFTSATMEIDYVRVYQK